MAKIIMFPTAKVRAEPKMQAHHSNAYKNMVRLLPQADTLESLNFYCESIEYMEQAGILKEGEYEALTETATARRMQIAKPEEMEIATTPGLYMYTPEMGEPKPVCQMEAHRGHYGKHVFIDTPLELKGRGIEEREANWIDGCQKQVEGWRSYRVTNRAFEILRTKYSISQEVLLD